MLKRGLVVTALLLTMMVTVNAMCPVAVTPPDSFVHLTDETQGLIVWDEQSGEQTFVVRQGYEGVASDFGLVLPTPSEPNLTREDDDLFRQLNTLTKDPDRGIDLGRQGPRVQTMDAEVEVVKQRQIGDFDLTVLQANESNALLDWLDRNNYTYGNRTEANIDHYINKDGYYFTAMKINVEAATCLDAAEFRIGTSPQLRQRLLETDTEIDDRCWLRGGLSPVAFTYEAKEPGLPLRIMAKPHDPSPMTEPHTEHNHTHDEEQVLPPGEFLLYTVGDQPLTVPGAKVQYANTVGSVEDPLADYEVDGSYLVRQRIKFDAHEVEEDLTFREAKPFYQNDEASVINPEDRDTENGIMKFDGVNQRSISFGSASVIDEASFQVSRASQEAITTLDAVTEDGLDVVLEIASLIEDVSLGFTLLSFAITVLIGATLSRRRSLWTPIVSGGLGAILLHLVAWILVQIGFDWELLASTEALILIPLMAGIGLVVGLLAYIVSTVAHYISLLEPIRRQLHAVTSKALVNSMTVGIGLALVLSRATEKHDLLEHLVYYAPIAIILTLTYLYLTNDLEEPIHRDSSDWLYFLAAFTLGILGIIVVLSLI
jgi:hypothetical protein